MANNEKMLSTKMEIGCQKVKVVNLFSYLD